MNKTSSVILNPEIHIHLINPPLFISVLKISFVLCAEVCVIY